MNPVIPRPQMRPGALAGLIIATALALWLTAPADAQDAAAGLSAVYSPGTRTLTVTGDAANNTIAIDRDATGTLLVNNGAIPIQGGPATVTNTLLVEVNGRGGDDQITVFQASGLALRARLIGGAGNDTLRGSANADELDGGAGNDSLLGGLGDDTLLGGDGADSLTGNDGNDVLRGGAGADQFVWNPGDDDDIVEGEGGADTLRFNGANVGEAIDISANGGRVRFFRNIANVVMDLDGVETVAFEALGGADTITVNSLAGTDVTRVAVNLVGSLGGTTGDAQADTVIVNGTTGNDRIAFEGSAAAGVTVSGLAARVTVTGSEAASDRVVVNALAGADTFDGSGVPGGLIGVTVDGGADEDTVEVNGGTSGESFTVTANGALVRFDRLQPGPFAFDIAAEQLIVKGNGGDDSFAATGNLAALIKITMDGGTGNDTILGSNGADMLIGGPGNDTVDGQQGNDTASLGGGDDVFAWDPGDGSDVVEGQGGNDTLRFNGSNGAEQMAVSANGTRVHLTRDLGNIDMDLDGVEQVEVNALGSADAITVNDLAGTAAKVVTVDLAGQLGGSTGDAQADTVTVNGTAGNDAFTFGGSATAGVTVSGLAAKVTITGGETANDRLVVNGLAGTDAFEGAGVPGGVLGVIMDGGADEDTVQVNGGNGAETFTVTANGTLARFDRLDPNPFAFDIAAENLIVKGNGGDDSFFATGNLAALTHITMDGGPGNDTINGSNGADMLIGGPGNDVVDGQQGADTALLGDGADTFQWDPGDGNDTVEGQGGADTLRFNASNAGEQMDVSANGARARVTRNIGTVVMDLDGVETLAFTMLGSADVVTVNNLAGTAVTSVDVNVAGVFGGTAGDGQPDTVIVYGTDGDDAITVAPSAAGVTVSGLAATVTVVNSEAAHDRLAIYPLGGADTVDASGLPAGVIHLTVDGWDGNDTLTGSAGDDTLLGGEGDDTLTGGPGDDLLDGGPGDNVVTQ
jgi:Ca2+-binding RTX toxin-like protein